MSGENNTGSTITGNSQDSYISGLVKYIPSEIVGAYICVLGIIYPNNAVNASSIPSAVSWIIFGIMAALTPIYIWKVTGGKSKPIALSQLVISFISFILWAFTLGGPFKTLEWYDARYGVLAAVLFTLLVPVFLVVDFDNSESALNQKKK